MCAPWLEYATTGTETEIARRLRKARAQRRKSILETAQLQPSEEIPSTSIPNAKGSGRRSGPKSPPPMKKAAREARAESPESLAAPASRALPKASPVVFARNTAWRKRSPSDCGASPRHARQSPTRRATQSIHAASPLVSAASLLSDPTSRRRRRARLRVAKPREHRSTQDAKRPEHRESRMARGPVCPTIGVGLPSTRAPTRIRRAARPPKTPDVAKFRLPSRGTVAPKSSFRNKPRLVRPSTRALV